MKKLDDYKEAQRQQVKIFKECFNSPAGKEVLKVLKEEFYDNEYYPGDGLEFTVGQRDVIYQILLKVESK